MTAPRFRKLRIVAQDPALRDAKGRIVTAEVDVPNEELEDGPRGYRVQVVDYDSSSGRFYKPMPKAHYGTVEAPQDPYAGLPARHASAGAFNEAILGDPQFHAQNVYAIAMRTLAHFERALGRRVSWSFCGHQLKAAPHAFLEPNAFYSPPHEGLMFGYFRRLSGPLVFTCLSHDIVAHEATHALLDGLRPSYMEPSCTDQAAFHEGFADVVAMLSAFSIREVVEAAVRRAQNIAGARDSVVTLSRLTIDALRKGFLFGLGEQFGEELSGLHGSALRRSVNLKPQPDLSESPEYEESHRRGELLVAAMMQAFLDAYRSRLVTLGRDESNRLPAVRVAEEGRDIAETLLTMSIRAIDYLPPTDVTFPDFISAILTADTEARPDDSRYGLRDKVHAAFAGFGFAPASNKVKSGCWEPPRSDEEGARPFEYAFTRHESMLRDRDEVFRFIWINRAALGLCDRALTEVICVNPCTRVDPEGFTLRETVAVYSQKLYLPAGDLKYVDVGTSGTPIQKPKGLLDYRKVMLLGGGSLIFDEYGLLKFHIHNSILNGKTQTVRLQSLFDRGYFDARVSARSSFAEMHARGGGPAFPIANREMEVW